MTRVRIVEVGPRDGLQNIAITVPTGVKVELIRRLARSNLRIIEATSFVSPQAVPQLADGAHVLDQIQDLRTSEPGSDNFRFPVLVPNVQGLISAHQAGVKEVAVFVSATEGFSQANTRCSVAESLVRVQKVAKMAKDMGIALRGWVF
jgi:hydroxymethylglutaryl-CoA lyase